MRAPAVVVVVEVVVVVVDVVEVDAVVVEAALAVQPDASSDSATRTDRT